MKVVHLMFSPTFGGSETFFVRLGRALQERGHPQHMIMAPNADRQAYLEEHGIPHTVLDFQSLRKILSLWQLRQTVKRERPDVLVTWKVRAARNAPRGPHAVIGRIGGFYEMNQYGRCDMVVANSPELMAFAQTTGRPDARFIANFAELTPMPPVDRSHIRRPLLFTSSRLQEQKGIDILIKAMPSTDAHLWIAGSGPQAEFRALAESLGVADRVEFLGWRTDVPALLAAAADVRARLAPRGHQQRPARGRRDVEADRHDRRPERQLVSEGRDRCAHRAGGRSGRPLRRSPGGDRQPGARRTARGRGTGTLRPELSEDAICAQWLALMQEAVAHKRQGSPRA